MSTVVGAGTHDCHRSQEVTHTRSTTLLEGLAMCQAVEGQERTVDEAPLAALAWQQTSPQQYGPSAVGRQASPACQLSSAAHARLHSPCATPHTAVGERLLCQPLQLFPLTRIEWVFNLTASQSMLSVH